MQRQDPLTWPNWNRLWEAFRTHPNLAPFFSSEVEIHHLKGPDQRHPTFKLRVVPDGLWTHELLIVGPMEGVSSKGKLLGLEIKYQSVRWDCRSNQGWDVSRQPRQWTAWLWPRGGPWPSRRGTAPPKPWWRCRCSDDGLSESWSPPDCSAEINSKWSKRSKFGKPAILNQKWFIGIS